MDASLREDALEVLLDRGRGDHKIVSDLRGGLTHQHQPRDLTFSVGEPVGRHQHARDPRPGNRFDDDCRGKRSHRLGAARHRNHDRPHARPDGEIPATGKTFAVDMGIFWTLGTGDLIVEERAYFDSTGMLAQLGLMG